jgi:hypothetical protein
VESQFNELQQLISLVAECGLYEHRFVPMKATPENTPDLIVRAQRLLDLRKTNGLHFHPYITRIGELAHELALRCPEWVELRDRQEAERQRRAVAAAAEKDDGRTAMKKIIDIQRAKEISESQQPKPLAKRKVEAS